MSPRPGGDSNAFVNHVFAVVDADTAKAVGTSALLRECADLHVQRVEADGGDGWTGRYMSMRTTYVELFGPGDAADAALPGSIGIALGGDRPGAVDAVCDRLAAHGAPHTKSLRKRVVDGSNVDWFLLVGPPDEAVAPPVAPTVDAWVMEYLASYMDRPEAAKRAGSGPEDTVSRRRYNDGAYRGALFSDLDAAHFAIERTRFVDRVLPLLTASGFRVQHRDDGATARGDESDLLFTFAAEARTGLREIRIRLDRPMDAQRSESIGRSTLTVGPGAEAHWTFAP